MEFQRQAESRVARKERTRKVSVDGKAEWFRMRNDEQGKDSCRLYVNQIRRGEEEGEMEDEGTGDKDEIKSIRA